MRAKTVARWAAIVPVSGGGKVEWAEKLKDIPVVWAFHDDADHSMPVAKTRELIASLKKIGHPECTEH